VRGLQQLEQALEVLVRVHYAAGIGQHVGQDVPRVRAALLMQRLRRFLPNDVVEGLDAHETLAARVYCATGIDQPCLLHLMGVPNRGQHALQAYRDWQQGDGAAELPLEHRQYLNSCLKRKSIREEVERAVQPPTARTPRCRSDTAAARLRGARCVAARA
jgi:hypothetical protein